MVIAEPRQSSWPAYVLAGLIVVFILAGALL